MAVHNDHAQVGDAAALTVTDDALVPDASVVFRDSLYWLQFGGCEMIESPMPDDIAPI